MDAAQVKELSKQQIQALQSLKILYQAARQARLTASDHETVRGAMQQLEQIIYNGND